MLVPAIHFPGGTCNEAIAFYQKVLNATVISVTHEHDAPPDSETGKSAADETRNHIIHAELIISGTRVNMADGADDVSPGSMFLFNIFLGSADEVSAVFHQLREGGAVLTELGPQFWTPLYGAVEDRFGIKWQLMANS
jgi:PhnB protein